MDSDGSSEEEDRGRNRLGFLERCGFSKAGVSFLGALVAMAAGGATRTRRYGCCVLQGAGEDHGCRGLGAGWTRWLRCFPAGSPRRHPPDCDWSDHHELGPCEVPCRRAGSRRRRRFSDSSLTQPS